MELDGKKAGVEALVQEQKRLEGKLGDIQAELKEYEANLNSVDEEYSLRSADLAGLKSDLEVVKTLIGKKLEVEEDFLGTGPSAHLG